MKIDTASDQGGVKHLTVNLDDKNIRLCNASISCQYILPDSTLEKVQDLQLSVQDLSTQ